MWGGMGFFLFWFVGMVLGVPIIYLSIHYFNTCWFKYCFICLFVDLFDGLLHNLLLVYC